MRRYLLNLVIWAFDIGFNVVILAGSPYETISSRVQKRIEHGDRWAKILGWVINFIMRNPNHCREARIPNEIIYNSPNWWKL